MIADAFSIAVILAPLAIYLAVHGIIRLTGRTLMLTTAGDVMFLAFAAIGAVAVGPAQLFFPTTAAVVFGWKVWLMIGLLYGLFASLLALLQRPGLVIYGKTAAEVHAALATACRKIDPGAVVEGRWNVHLPASRWRLNVHRLGARDAVGITSLEPAADPETWYRILAVLRQTGIDSAGQRRTRGLGYIAVSLGIVGIIVAGIAATPQRFGQEFWAWLRQ